MRRRLLAWARLSPVSTLAQGAAAPLGLRSPTQPVPPSGSYAVIRSGDAVNPALRRSGVKEPGPLVLGLERSLETTPHMTSAKLRSNSDHGGTVVTFGDSQLGGKTIAGSLTF